MNNRIYLFSVRAGLATGVLYYVCDLSRGDRTWVDYVVIGLVCAAILWNLYRLGFRLHQVGGFKDVWHLQRTILFWVLGWLNTGLIRPEDAGGWKNWLGWGFLLLAALDSCSLGIKEKRAAEGEVSRGNDLSLD